MADIVTFGNRVATIEAVFLYRTDWERSVEDAKRRNANA